MFSMLFLVLVVLRLSSVYVHAKRDDPNQVHISVNGTGKIFITVNGSSQLHEALNEVVVTEYEPTAEQEILEQTLEQMCLISKGLWNLRTIPTDENIQFFPILHTTKINMILMQIYHEYGLAAFYSHDEFLYLPIKLASLMNKFQQSSNITVKFKNYIYHGHTINEEYLHDLKHLFHSGNASMFEYKNGTNDTENMSEELVNWWFRANTMGRHPERENLWTPGLANYQIAILEYSACWNISNNISANNDTKVEKLAVLFETPMYNSKKIDKICFDAFSSKTMLGYRNDSRLGYQAVGIPYTNPDFSMAIILPNRNKNLEIFVNFTPQDYLELLEDVSVKEEYIHFIIPFMHLSMVEINEKGTKINSRKNISCNSAQPHKPLNLTEDLDPILFDVSRPFGVMIFHKETKLVLWQALIRNPNSTTYSHRKFVIHERSRGKQFDDGFIVL